MVTGLFSWLRTRVQACDKRRLKAAANRAATLHCSSQQGCIDWHEQVIIISNNNNNITSSSGSSKFSC
jgi:hypothetical protein